MNRFNHSKIKKKKYTDFQLNLLNKGTKRKYQILDFILRKENSIIYVLKERRWRRV